MGDASRLNQSQDLGGRFSEGGFDFGREDQSLQAREIAANDLRRGMMEHDEEEKRDEATRIGGNYLKVKD
jgi:hypothetical protein